VFVPPAVAERARAEPLGLPAIESQSLSGPARETDGLDWPLRLAVVWQFVSAEPVRKTIAGALFKKDRGRFEPTGLLAPPDQAHAPADAGLLSLAWAEAAGLLRLENEALFAAPFPRQWDGPLPELIADLTADLFPLQTWDPLVGETDGQNPVPAFPTAFLLSMLLLATAPAGKWVSPAAVATWLWEHRPGWQAGLSKDAARRYGRPWVDVTLLGLAHPLGLVDVFPRPDDPLVRLSPLGRHLFAGGLKPHAPAAFPQTLLVQPNAEILAYRQGLTPSLVSFLTRVAAWKGIGPACTLELTQDQSYRGLETGLTVAEVLQTLARHSTRPIPPAVDDLLRRWATKRERVTVFTSATLVEFATAADLDDAVARGVVSIKLTDRIGLTADGKEPDYRNLRLTGNRDYESRPAPCLEVEPDGVTLVPDAGTADLLLEPELLRIAELVPDDPPGVRRFRLTPDKVRAAVNGSGLDDLDGWFQSRSGSPIPAPARLFAAGPASRPARVERLVVLRFPTPEVTDGVCQWPVTADRVADRLGPTTVAVDEADLPPLIATLTEIGVGVETTAGY
jgi:Helicase conserved C-terminal domain